MSDQKKHKKTGKEEFLRYAANQMSGKERNAFERELEKDPFAAEALEGLSSLTPAEREADLAALDRQLPRKGSSRNPFLWYRMAAAVAFLVVVSSLFFTLVIRNRNLLTNEMARSEESVQKPDAPATAEAMKTEEDLSETPAISRERATSTDKLQTAPLPQPASQQKEAETVPRLAAISHDDEAEIVVSAEKKESPAPAVTTQPTEALAGAPVMERQKAAAAGKEAAATNTLRGTVISSEDRQPLPGATVFIRGTTSATVTDAKGTFNLTVPDTPVQVVAAYIGMESEEVQAAQGEDLLIEMDPSIAGLDEVVVIGYGTSRKSALDTGITGAELTSDTYNTYLPAEPVTGKKAFDAWIEENISFPASDSLSTRAVVVLEFSLDSRGKPVNIKAIRSPGADYSSIAIQLIENGPAWKPATRNGEVVNEAVRLRLVFKR
jgi:hypothetical protein